MLTSLEWQTLEKRRRISRLVMMLKLFTVVGVANLLLEVNPELLYGAGPNCGVW
jgi:hypothetical protein